MDATDGETGGQASLPATDAGVNPVLPLGVPAAAALPQFFCVAVRAPRARNFCISLAGSRSMLACARHACSPHHACGGHWGSLHLRRSRHSLCEGRFCVCGGGHVHPQKRHTCHAW